MDFTPAVRTSRTGRRGSDRAPLTGAVRRSELRATRPSRRPHARKLAVGLVLVAAGVLAGAAGTAKEPSPPLPLASASLGVPAIPEPVPLPEPTFFFDDAADALSERLAGRAATVVAPAAVPSSAAASIATDAVPETAPSPATDDDVLALVGDLGPTPTSGGVADGPPDLAARQRRAAAPSGSSDVDVVVGPGDTLSGILNDHGVTLEQMPSLLDDDVVTRHLSRLSIGQKFTITRDADGRFRSLSGRIGNDTRITLRRAGNGFATAATDLPIEKERVVTSGTIEQSLYLAAEQAELKQSTIMKLADIFQWELDFARDIRKGDSFAVVYDRLYREGKYIGDGDILAAEFERGGRTHRAIRFVADDGTAGYYSPDGTSKRRTFTRHPVDVVRITSKFDPNRLHPVLHQIRAHRGVDYGAPHGSPIRATADGVVRFSGIRGAYGKTVVLQHGERVETLYAHMSRISDKSVVGRRVRQGDVIGYVGNTGRVTGTHLHYEFRVNDEHVDPLTVELPAAAPIAAEYREALRDVADELVAQMKSVLPGAAASTVASNDAPSALDELAADVSGERTAVSLER